VTNEELDRARAEEAQRLFLDGDELAVVHAARLAREGWTPPVTVDPDLIEAREIVARIYDVSWPERADAIRTGLNDYDVENVCALAAIKRGRELERAEAQPGMVWVKHDGSTICPVDRDIWVLTKTFGYNPCVNRGKRLAWQSVSFYCVITPPAEDVA